MSFKLPDSLTSAVEQAVTLNLADVTSLRCRWPSVRDVTWASAQAEKRGSGTASSNNLYASHLIAASLIGVAGMPLADMVTSPELKALLEKEANLLTDDEHAQLSEAKHRDIISRLPGDLIVIAYNAEMTPWLNKRNGLVKKSQAEDAEIVKIKTALDLLDENPNVG